MGKLVTQQGITASKERFLLPRNQAFGKQKGGQRKRTVAQSKRLLEELSGGEVGKLLSELLQSNWGRPILQEIEENALRPIAQAVQLGYKASKRRQRSQWLSVLRSAATFVSAKEWRSLGADFTSKAWTQAGHHLKKYGGGSPVPKPVPPMFLRKVSDDVIATVQDYCIKNSRPADNKTVTLKRKQKAQPAEVVPLRYWNKSITAVWQSFQKVFPETDISLKTFRKYAPPQIKRCKRRTAVCSKCLNGAKCEQQLKQLLRKMEASTEEGRQLQAMRKEEKEVTSLPRSCLLGVCAHDLHQDPSATASISSSSISSSLIARIPFVAPTSTLTTAPADLLLEAETWPKHITCLRREVEHYYHHREHVEQQKQSYRQQKEQLKAQTEGILVLDYKETLRLGQSLDEETRTFYKQPRRAVFGAVLLYREAEGQPLRVHYFDVVSAVLMNNSWITVRWLREIFACPEWKQFNFKTIHVWMDNGPSHFRTGETFFYFLSMMCKDAGIADKLSINFYADNHGKSICDCHFSMVSKAVSEWTKQQNEEGINNELWTSQDLKACLDQKFSEWQEQTKQKNKRRRKSTKPKKEWNYSVLIRDDTPLTANSSHSYNQALPNDLKVYHHFLIFANPSYQPSSSLPETVLAAIWSSHTTLTPVKLKYKHTSPPSSLKRSISPPTLWTVGKGLLAREAKRRRILQDTYSKEEQRYTNSNANENTNENENRNQNRNENKNRNENENENENRNENKNENGNTNMNENENRNENGNGKKNRNENENGNENGNEHRNGNKNGNKTRNSNRNSNKNEKGKEKEKELNKKKQEKETTKNNKEQKKANKNKKRNQHQQKQNHKPKKRKTQKKKKNKKEKTQREQECRMRDKEIDDWVASITQLKEAEETEEEKEERQREQESQMQNQEIDNWVTQLPQSTEDLMELEDQPERTDQGSVLNPLTIHPDNILFPFSALSTPSYSFCFPKDPNFILPLLQSMDLETAMDWQ